jgi:hypothetical protein
MLPLTMAPNAYNFTCSYDKMDNKVAKVKSLQSEMFPNKFLHYKTSYMSFR